MSGISRHALYYEHTGQRVRRLRSDEYETREIVRKVALEHPTYGFRRVWAVLRMQEGLFISRKRVYRMLAEESLLKEAHFPRPRLPQTGNLSSELPNTRWFTDLTYLDTTDCGPVPFMPIEDSCTRKIVGYELMRSCGASDALALLERTVLSIFPDGRGPGLALKTDGGPQFRAEKFRNGARLMCIRLENTRKHRPEDNGTMESFNGHFKADYMWVREPVTFGETKRIVDEAVFDYNNRRPHSSLNYLTPVEYEKRVANEVRS
jgi:putative transposase